jgi:hypothetical protein
MSDEELEAFGLSRRTFFKKMIALGFAVPIVSSFALDGVAGAADGAVTPLHHHHHHHGNSHHHHGHHRHHHHH